MINYEETVKLKSYNEKEHDQTNTRYYTENCATLTVVEVYGAW